MILFLRRLIQRLLGQKKKTIAFVLQPGFAEEFFLRVMLLTEDNEKNRLALLKQMAKEGKVDAMYSTERTKQQIVDDYKRHFDVLDYTERNTNE